MSDPTQPTFYSPWPLFGKKFHTQLDTIRHDIEVAHVLSRASVFDKDPSSVSASAVQGWEVGDRTKHNRYRTYWDNVNTELKFQKNRGTEACPEWETQLSIDCETGRVTVFNQFRVLGGFYDIMSGLDRVFEWPRPKISDDFYNVFQIGVSTADGFYLTADKDGFPILRLSDRIKGGGGGGLSTVRFQTTDPSPVFDSDTLKFDRGFFYMGPDSAGKPIVSLNERRIDVGQTGEPEVLFPEVKDVRFNENDFYVTQNADTNKAIVNFRGTAGSGGLSNITVTETDDFDPSPPSFSTDTVKFFGREFYLTPDSAGNPIVALREPFTGDNIGSGAIVKEFINEVEVKVTHNFLRKPLYWAIFDDADEAFIPEKVDVSDLNFAYFYMTTPTTGTAMLMTGANAGSVQVSTTNNPVTQFIRENLKLNRDDFYLSSSSLGDPIVNLNEKRVSVGQTGGLVKFNGINDLCFNENEFYVTQNADTSKAIINFRGTAGGGGGVADLQEAYDASSSPEIVVNSSNGALTIRDNATPIGADLLEVQTNAGVDLFSVDVSDAVFGVDVDPSADVTRDFGSDSLRWNDVRSRQGAFVHGYYFTTGTVSFAAPTAPSREQGGLIFGIVEDVAGTSLMQLGGGYYAAIGLGGSVYTGAAGHTSRLRNLASAGIMFGEARSAGAGTKNSNIYSEAYAYGSFTGGRAYTFGTTGSAARIYNYGYGAFLWASLNSQNGGTQLATVTSGGSGGFCQGFINSGGSPILRVGGLGGFAQGAITGGTSGGTIEATGYGSFAQGNTSGGGRIAATAPGSFAQGQTANLNSRIFASAAGGFAHGQANGGYDIDATAAGAFAVGRANGASIIASAINAAQFGEGTNALADSLQVGVGGTGIRLNGNGDPGASVQNGDIWVSAGGDVIIHSGGVDVTIA